MNIEHWPLDRIIPYARNPRKNESAVSAVKSSIKEFGFRQPIVVDRDGVIVAGHTRYMAAQQLELKTVPVHVATELTPIQIKAYRLADNRTAQNATWDDELLGLELEELKADDFDLDLTGFNEEEIAKLIAADAVATDVDAESQIDKGEELLVQWGVEAGQLWALGEHRLICGDCTDMAIMNKVMDGESAQLLFTSPPYWVGKDYETQTSIKEVINFIDNCVATWTAYTNTDGGRIIINCSTASAKALNPKADPETLFTMAWWQEAMRKKNWLLRHCRVWLKHGDMAAPHVAASSDVIDQHWEVIPEFLPTFYYPDGLRRGQEKIGTKWAQLGIWTDIQGDRSAGGVHCAAFPLELPARYIRLYTVQKEHILEPFAGSGTTIIACERLNRKCRAIEISPAYVAVALQRFLDATGVTPEKIS